MKKLVLLSLSLIISLLFVQNAFAADMAKVRILHASPDAPSVDVVVDGEVVVEDAKYKDVTDYLELKRGPHKIQIFASGTVDESKPVLEKKVRLKPGSKQTVAAINKLDSIELALIDDSAKPQAGKAKVRVGHFSPDAPPVDVAQKTGNVLFKNVKFKDITKYKDLDPGSYDLNLREAGTDKKIMILPQTEFEDGVVYTLLPVGFANGQPPLEAIILTNEE
ncbi:DUF4397 domain-containing protein [Bacillus carboniphilus]|uniref:DUF4397 domain-containing protein n=1 Tax=Bacillus carboniphilus TaxID=86663 RepID=A0ABY9JTI6_9BACI|nr:DUF4397 domain-containing protein [Bacillus carboniphilus]WLR42711.1 DUF4397 domain-containing protein [Bacillus carboniphilus]